MRTLRIISLIIIFFISFTAILSCHRHTSDPMRYLSPFEEENAKVLLSVGIDQPPRDWKNIKPSILPGKWANRTTVLKKGLHLAVLVNERCLREHPESRVNCPLTQSLSIPPASTEKRSQSQTYRVTLEEDLRVADLERLAHRNPCIEGISHARRATADAIFNDPMLIKQAHLESLQTLSAMDTFLHPQGGVRKPVVIAVLDTGLDLNHPDLRENLWVNEAEAAGKPGIDDDNNGFIDDINGFNFADNKGDPNHFIVNDHGTHVAGLAAAISGNSEGGIGIMGQKVKLMALNVFGKNWASDTIDIDRAIRYAADNGAHVMNISVGGPGRSDTTAAAIAYALTKGTTVVVSAGNLKQNITDEFYYSASYASRYPGMLSVAASDAGTKALCDFSSFSPTDVKIVASGCDSQSPKEGLLSTRIGAQYGYRKGTSMSAPLVSAAAALAYGATRDRTGAAPTPAEIETILLEACERIASLEPYARNGCHLNLMNLARVIERRAPLQ